jgi:hypothetical protein
MAIMMGLAIGAAMGGGIAALRGGTTNDILKGALIGGATGAVGGGISSLATAGAGAGAVGASGATVAPVVEPLATSTISATPSAISPALAGQSSSITNILPVGSAPLSGVATGAPSIASTSTNLAATPAGTGFFESGVGKFLAENKGTLGMGAAGLLMSNKGNSQSSQPDSDSYIRPYTYDPKNQTYAAQEPVKASDWGTRMIAEGGAIRMAEGGDPEVATEQQQRESTSNPTLEALAAIQQAQQTYQPPQPTVSQGITQPLIQPQMAEVQQRYATPQRAVPADFQYQAPQFVSYGIGGGGGSGGYGYGSDGGGGFIDPTTGKPYKPTNPIIATKPATPTPTAPNSDEGKSYYEKYPIAEVYDYATNQPTRPFNPTEGSPEFNIPSNNPVDISSGLADEQQRFANIGYTDYIPSANIDYWGGGGDADGGLIADKHPKYAMGGGIGAYYPEPDDGNRNFGGIDSLNQGPQYPMQGYAMGGQLGGYSDGGQLLRGPGDGVSDDIPAQIGNRQPARLADGEFVVPARIVSELGNGSTDAGAKRLYAMMDRIQKNRGKTVGKGKVAVNSKSDKYLPA